MKGATEFAKLFDTGQYGRLYIVSGNHARGETFHIYILPEGEAAISNGSNNGPLNSDKVEVYGVISGNPGWTEEYGWLHQGKWQEDFAEMATSRRVEVALKNTLSEQEIDAANVVERGRKAALLAAY